MFDWNQEKVEELKTHWLAGLPASAIASIMHVTRNMIIGKVHRLELPQRKQSPQSTSGSLPKVPRPKPVPRMTKAPLRPQPLPKVTAETLPSTATGLLNLGEYQCRYPLDVRGKDGFMLYCGERAQYGSYCEEHARACFNYATFRH